MGKILNYSLLFVFLFVPYLSRAQTGPPRAFKYQAVARNIAGAELSNQALSVKIGIYSGNPAGTLEWEEIHSVTTDSKGLYVINIGMGASTGSGSLSSFTLINWGDNNYYLKREVDFAGSGYIDIGTIQFFSVPYSFYSAGSKSVGNIELSNLIDVDTTGLNPGLILKWSGNHWKPEKDNHSDTVSFALHSNYSSHADTANYAYQIINPKIDTAYFAYAADSSAYSYNAGSVINSVNSVHSDTATYAPNYLPYNWSITGNAISSGKYLGTNSKSDLIFKSSALERLKIDSTGRLTFGISSTNVSSHFIGNDGFIAKGNFNAGSLSDSSYNARMMWYPRKASLRIGDVVSNSWSDSNIGNYSTAFGYDPLASGLYSTAIGYKSKALGENCVSIGRYCSTNGVLSNGGSIAIGDSCIVTSTRSLALGYKNRSDGGIVMGYKNRVYWASQTSAFGYNLYNSGDCSIALGSNANLTGEGAFVFSDTSSTKVTNLTDHRFLVRASGGVIFYSDTALSNGVQLFPGGGAWASVSDKNKKENFKSEDPEIILDKVLKLKISTWNYKTQNRKIRHLGPMAQDFYSAFGLGENNTSISTIDIDGITMIGIKAIEKRTADLTRKITGINELKEEIKNVGNFNELEDRLNKIEKILNE